MRLRSPVLVVLTALAGAHCGSPKLGPSAGPAAPPASGFTHYDATARAKMLTELYGAMSSTYSLWDLKKSRISLDPDALFKSAIAAESAEPDPPDVPSQAAANLAFFDRVRALAAKMQDTHHTAHEVASRPKIHNGMNLALVGGHVVVATVFPHILQLGKPPTLPQPGWTVESIDGRDPLAVAKDLAAYVSGSSPDYVQDEAILDITGRTFAYPDQAVSTYVFQDSSGATTTLKIPYFVTYTMPKSGAVRSDALLYLAAHGYLGNDGSPLPATGAPPPLAAGADDDRTGLDSSGPLVGMQSQGTWDGIDSQSGTPSPSPVMRLGTVARNGHTYGVIQLYDYDAKLCPDGSPCTTDEQVDFTDPMASFIANLKANRQPLILDLRSNNGGRGGLPPELLALVAATGASYPEYTMSWRVTDAVKKMVGTWPEPGVTGDSAQRESEAVGAVPAAAAAGKTETAPLLYGAPIVPDTRVGGYDQPVVALLGPECLSACDVQAMLFKASGRVILLGTHSNGTGAGFWTDKPYLQEADWVDSSGVIEARVPNFLFGAPGPAGQTDFTSLSDPLSLDQENQPTPASVLASPTLNDILNQGQDVLEQAEAQLDAAATAAGT